MANEQNLIPFTSEQSHEEAVKNGRKGGIESGKKRRLQGAFERALDAAASSAEFREIFDRFAVLPEEKNYASAIACALVAKAASGNLAAIALLRDTIGEKPKEEIDLSGGVVIVDDLADKA